MDYGQKLLYLSNCKMTPLGKRDHMGLCLTVASKGPHECFGRGRDEQSWRMETCELHLYLG